MSKITTLLNSKIHSFTKSEKKISDYVLSSKKEDIIKMTVSDLASLCKVSEATLVRFVKKIGFESFQEFKLEMATDNDENISDEEKDITIVQSDSPDQILKKIKLGCIRSIENTSTIINIGKFLQAVNFIRSAKRIEIYGVGSSFAVAKILQYKLTRLGFPSFSFEDPHMQAISAATMNVGDLAFGISQSGFY